jgi:hypothetical protein
MSVYYGKLKTLWDETLIYDPIPSCSCGIMKTIVVKPGPGVDPAKGRVPSFMGQLGSTYKTRVI